MTQANARGYDLVLSALRIGFGLMLAWYHGRGHITAAWANLWHGQEWKFIAFLERTGYPLARWLAVCIALTEFFGGLLLGIGWLTRYAAGFVALNTGMAVLYHLRSNTDGELAWHYFLPALFFVFSPPGQWSVDAWWKRRKTANQ